MKKFLSIIVLFFCQSIFCQEYHFDYYTVYEYKKEEKDKAFTIKEVYYSNSKDVSYLLFVKIDNYVITDCYINDYKNQKTLFFIKADTSPNESNFSFVRSMNLDLRDCKSSKKFDYQINYSADNNFNIINIQRFQGKKMVEESFHSTKPSIITQQQEYNFGILATPIWCEKFKLKNEGVVVNSYFIKKGKKHNIRNLLEINKISFDLKGN